MAPPRHDAAAALGLAASGCGLRAEVQFQRVEVGQVDVAVGVEIAVGTVEDHFGAVAVMAEQVEWAEVDELCRT